MRITAAGSLPGTDFRGALVAMTEALPQLLPLPELPERGISAAMIGRALGLIEDLGFDVQPSGWRLTTHPSREQRRAAAIWRQDLDDAEELLQGFTGQLKIAVAGPWTLAASVERPRGDALLSDHGARRELAQALALAVDWLRTELVRRLPAVELVVQIDEPLLVAVRDGQVPTASGFSKHRRVERAELAAALGGVAGGAILHCCAPGRWLEEAREAGFSTAWQDARLLHLDDLARWYHEGGHVILGVVDTLAPPQGVDALVSAALRPLRQVEADAERIMLGTACGLAGWAQRDIVPQLEALRRAAGLVEEALSGG